MHQWEQLRHLSFIYFHHLVRGSRVLQQVNMGMNNCMNKTFTYLLYTTKTQSAIFHWLSFTHTSGNDDELLDFDPEASGSESTEHSTSSSKSMTSPRSLNKSNKRKFNFGTQSMGGEIWKALLSKTILHFTFFYVYVIHYVYEYVFILKRR